MKFTSQELGYFVAFVGLSISKTANVLCGSAGDVDKRRDSLHIIKMLLDGKANINSCDRQGNSSLLSVMTQANYKASKLLLQRNANVNLANAASQTPLLVCVASCSDLKEEKKRRKFEQLLQILLQRKADTTVVDHQGMSPLILAASCGLTSIVKLLLHANADIRVHNKQGVSALIAAALRSRVNTLNFLLCNTDADVHERCTSSGDDILGIVLSRPKNDRKKHIMTEAILKAKSDPNGVNNTTYDAPLHTAAATGCATCVALLLKHRANLNLPNTCTGRTALMYAVVAQNAKIVRQLLVV